MSLLAKANSIWLLLCPLSVALPATSILGPLCMGSCHLLRPVQTSPGCLEDFGYSLLRIHPMRHTGRHWRCRDEELLIPIPPTPPHNYTMLDDALKKSIFSSCRFRSAWSRLEGGKERVHIPIIQVYFTKLLFFHKCTNCIFYQVSVNGQLVLFFAATNCAAVIVPVLVSLLTTASISALWIPGSVIFGSRVYACFAE